MIMVMDGWGSDFGAEGGLWWMFGMICMGHMVGMVEM